MNEFFQKFFTWAWSLITGIQPLVNWLFTPVEILGMTIAPIYLIGAGAIIAGIVRAILGIL